MNPLTPGYAPALYFCILLRQRLRHSPNHSIHSGTDMNALKQIAFRFLLLLIAFAAVSAHTALAQQWKQTNGPFGGQIRCMATSGTTIYAGTMGHGVFQSKDNGATWSPIRINGTTLDTTVLSIASSGNTIIAGTRGGLALISTDNGATWSMSQATQQQEDISSVAVRGTTLFASSFFEGVLVSTDNGGVWTVRNKGLKSTSISAMAANGNTVYAALANPSPGYSNLRKTTNDGASWDTINYLEMNPNVHVIGAMNSILVAGTDGGVYFSTDGGGHWVQNNTGLTDTTVYSFTANSTTAFVGTVDYASNGGGVYSYDLSQLLTGQWKSANTGMSGFGSDKIYAMATAGSNVLVGTDNGVYASADNAAHWAASNKGLAAMTITALRASGNLLVAGTDNCDVHISNDNGATWTHTSDGMIDLVAGTRPAVYDVAISGTTIFAATDSGVYSSTDNGTHWTLGNNALRDTAVHALYTNGTVLLAGSYSGIYASLNNAATFSFAGTGFTAHNVSALTANGATVYAGSNEGGVFSAAAGIAPTWTQIKTGLESAASTPVSSLTADGTNVFAGTLGSGVFVNSTGTSWTQISNGMPNFLTVTALANYSDTLFVASQTQGVFRVRKGPAQWVGTAFGLTDTTIRSIAVSNSTLFAGSSDYGVMSSPAGVAQEGGGAGVRGDDALSFDIGAIAPNPTHGPLRISFSLVKSGIVSLSLFDVAGHEVSLISGESVGEGAHEISFDASKLTNGIYLCRLSANGTSITRNVVIAH